MKDYHCATHSGVSKIIISTQYTTQNSKITMVATRRKATAAPVEPTEPTDELASTDEDTEDDLSIDECSAAPPVKKPRFISRMETTQGLVKPLGQGLLLGSVSTTRHATAPTDMTTKLPVSNQFMCIEESLFK
jgi:hypothetical protein